MYKKKIMLIITIFLLITLDTCSLINNENIVKTNINYTNNYKAYSLNSSKEISNNDILYLKSKHKLYENKNLIFKANPKKEYITSYGKEYNIYFLTTDKNIYIKEENQSNWKKIYKKDVGIISYLLSSAVVEFENIKYLFIGSSLSGLHYTPINKFLGKTKFKNLNYLTEKCSFSSPSSGYNDEISSLINFDNKLFVGYNYGKNIGYITMINGRFRYKITNTPIDKKNLESIKNFKISNNILYCESNKGIYKYNSNGKNWSLHNAVFNNNSYNDIKIQGIYLPTPYLTTKSKIDNQIKKIKDIGLNAIVINLKDDTGYITYDSKNQFAKSHNLIKKRIPLKYLIKKCKKENIYIIARLVAFKDYLLFKKDNYKYSLINKNNGKPWIGSSKERWIDPHNKVVQKYLIDIAYELEELGVDEIQYDYIRFSSTGSKSNPLKSIGSKYNKEGYSKSHILNLFLSKAKSKLNIPISADIYGYQSFYKMSDFIGQDIQLFADNLDVIYPMFYPSHFAPGFYQYNVTQYLTNYFLYNHGVQRINQTTKYKVGVRPWIQFFKWRVDGDFFDYVQAQIDGIKDAGIDSFILWNASGKYTHFKNINF